MNRIALPLLLLFFSCSPDKPGPAGALPATGEGTSPGAEVYKPPPVFYDFLSPEMASDIRYLTRRAFEAGSFRTDSITDTIAVHPLLEPFRMIVRCRNGEENIHSIELWEGARLLQRIPEDSTETLDWEFPRQYSQTGIFHEDWNFDGYEDLGISGRCGMGGNCYTELWRFNPSTGKFVYDSVFNAHCCEPERDTLNRIISFSSHDLSSRLSSKYRWSGDTISLIESESIEYNAGRHCGEEPDREKSSYRTVKGKPLLVRYEVFRTWHDSAGYCPREHIIRKRVGGRLKTVFRRKIIL